MYIPSERDIGYLIDAAETISTDDDIPKYISYRLFMEAQQWLLRFGDDENAARLRERVRQGFGDLTLRSVVVPGGPVPNYTDHQTEENGPIIKVLVEFYLEYNEKNKIDEVEGSSETREKFLTTSKLLRTALKMLIQVERGDTSEEDFIRVNGIPEEFVQDTKYDEGSYNIIESSSTAAATDLQASRVNTELRRSYGFQANMDVPISKIDIEYLIDAAEKASFQRYIEEYIPYRLFEEARETLERFKNDQTSLIGHAENTADLESRIRKGLSSITCEGIPKRPEGYRENESIIQVLVQFYRRYNKTEKIDELHKEYENHKKYKKYWGFLSPNFQVMRRYFIREKRILTISKALRTALKMLCRAERGDTSEEVFIQENEIPNEFLQDTEYDDRPDLLPEANMDFPISKIDIEYLIDAAEKAREEGLPKYISYRLFNKARDTLRSFEQYQTLLFGPAENNADLVFGPAENTADLEIKLSLGLLSVTDEGTNIPECPEGYIENDLTIQVLVQFYRRYNEDKSIDEIREEDKIHKKEGILSENYQVLEGRSAMRERILTTAKALRTALKMLPRVERGDASEENFIRENDIPEQFLQDTEYDEEGSNEAYNIIPFDGRTNWLPAEVQEAIASLELGITDFPPRTQGHDVLDCLQKFFKFQESSVSNQRENIVNLLSNELMRLGTPGEQENIFGLLSNELMRLGTPGEQESSVSNQHENISDLLSIELMGLGTSGEQALEAALEKVFSRTLDNYTEWCSYLSIKPIWKNTDENATGEDENATGEDENVISKDENATGEDENVISKDKKILYISLYYLIWGEAANVRFLPECLCYIFHHMSEQLDKYLRLNRGSLIEQVPQPLYEGSFIDQVIQPLYKVIAAEAKIKKEKNVSHSKWRNYDDFNEYFWSKDCLELSWPFNGSDSPFFSPPEGSTTVFGKTSFVERRTFLHLYHSFHRMWIFHVMMFQALAIFAFNDENLNSKTLRKILIVGPTYFLMKLIQSMLDIWLKDGAYSRTSRVDVLRIRFRIICFTSTLIIFFLGMKFLQQKTSPVEESIVFYACIVVLVIYACIIKWINQLEVYVVRRMDEELLDLSLKEEYVGRGMDEKPTDYNKYMVFWIVTLAFNIAYTYCYLIRPLVRPTRDITDVSKNIHNMLAIGSLWASAICAYIVGSHVSYNVTSAVVGTFVGHKDRLGNIKFLGDVHKCFNKIPTAFMYHLHSRESPLENNQEDVKKLDAAEFSPFWNKIVMNLREEDYISDLEQYALSMPEKSGRIGVIQWPLFILVGKIFHATRLLQRAQQPTQSRWHGVWEILLQRAQQPTQSRRHGVWARLLQRVQQHTHKDLWDEISKDDVYMKYAVEACFHSVKFILHSVLNNEGKEWVEKIRNDIESGIARNGNLCSEFQLNELDSFVNEISKLAETLSLYLHAQPDLNNRVLNNVIRHKFLGEKIAGEQISISDSDWRTDPELRLQIGRLHLLLTMDKSADHVPRNREARRRLEFFTNSLFMSMPEPKPVRKMLSLSVLTPYYEETVIYSLDELRSRNDDGVTLIDYLKNLYPDEWMNYCERIDRRYTDDRDAYQLRLWASYRGQTLARTVRGTMYYQKALLLQAYREMLIAEGVDDQPGSSSVDDQPGSSSVDDQPGSSSVDALKKKFGSQSLNKKCLDKAKAHVDLKFTYVVSCQKYGEQKSEGKDVAADIAFLLKKNEGLRVAFVYQVNDEFYSKLLKADKNGKDKEVYSIKLPGDPRLGEGKPENQNHAIVFTRGNAIQTIDMNQDNYFEETLKMRNLLEEFHREHVIRPPTILGIREHIFTGSASSLASFMSNQETGFVTLGQRVIANPLKVRMHYGHPDVFDRVFHITRGGISKASRGINISEDIYAGFNSTLRQGSVTHHEYIQVGKGRDVGFNQIATFEGKVAGGNGEQVLSRDLYRLGQRFDFFRMLSFYYTTVGYYFSSLLMVITLYILLYGNLIMALSGTRVPHVLNDIDMAPEWFLMIVLLPAIYMLLVPYLEQGLEKAVESFLAMFFSLGSIFFAFSLGTRIHWFGRTIIHGGASYQATGRGFVLHHIEFSDNYRRYSRSHFVKGMEVLFLVVVYIIYGFHSVRAFYNNLLLLGGSILSISWIVSPFLFDSSPFDPNKNSEDWKDWNNWRNHISDKVEDSWEAWWNKELDHIRTPAGRVIETILSLRFFIFPLVVGYKLDVQGLGKSFSNCVIPWICLVVILFFYEVFYKKKQVIHFFSKWQPLATIGALAIVCYYSAFGDMLTFTIAIITIWGFISLFNSRVATIGALAIACYYFDFAGMLAFIIAIITTIWGFISICVAWKPALEIFSLWIPVKFLAWICATGMQVLSFNINARDDLSMLLLYLLIYVSDACEAWKPTLKRFSLWTPVLYLAWICDTGMGALMFKIANMFSQRSIKQYLVRNMFDQNISELLHKSSTENALLHGRGF